MYMCSAYVLMTAATLTAVLAENCGYVRRPLADNNHTVVISFDCKQSTPFSHDVTSHLPHNVTHAAVHLRNCYTVPVGLFINVPGSLKSVTVASEDALQLPEATFEGLEHVTELRLLGFSSLQNVSRSVFQPLRSIETLILDRFCRSHIALSYLGSMIQELSGTPLKRLVLNDIRDVTLMLEYTTMNANDFRITNASVKELIISNTPLHYEGSIRRAFPHLVCFNGSNSIREDNSVKSLAVMWDLIFLSTTLKEFVQWRSKYVPILIPVTIEKMRKVFYDAVKKYYHDLWFYLLQISHEEDCTYGVKFKLGANISKITVNRMDILFVQTVTKPICLDENNILEYTDFTGSPLPSECPSVRGLTKLKYLSLEDTGIKSFPKRFLEYFPALETLKLNKLDIQDFIESADGHHLFLSCSTLKEIHLDNCRLKMIPTTLFSVLFNLEILHLPNNVLRNLDFDLSNCTRLNILNFRNNNIKRFAMETIDQLNHLAVQKPKGHNLIIDLSNNTLHCLCNSTHFVRWLQRSPTDSNIEFLDLDSYSCLHPNGSVVHVSTVSVSELEQHCSVLTRFINGSACPCDDTERTRLSRVLMSLDGFFCRNEDGDLVSMKYQPLPSCFNQFLRASFIAPVVVGGILAITVLVTIGLLIYHRNGRQERQIRECLQMNPVRFVHAAIQYVMMQNHAEEEHTTFDHDIFIFVQDDDRCRIHNHFIETLRGKKTFITGDDFLPGAAIAEALEHCIGASKWIVPVITSNFLSTHVCVDFINRVQFSRPHALIPVVWEQPLPDTDLNSVAKLLRDGDPLYWPGDQSAPEDQRRFWSALLDRCALC